MKTALALIKPRIDYYIKEEEDNSIVQIDLPFGQRLLKAGFQKITDRDLRKFLKCDEIANMENEKRKQKVKANLQMQLKEEHPDAYNLKIREYRTTTECSFLKKSDFWFLRERYYISLSFNSISCSFKKVPLDNYIDGIIPDRCYQSIIKAKQLGIKEFEVVYPTIEEVIYKDPIIIGKVGNNMIYIDEWI